MHNPVSGLPGSSHNLFAQRATWQQLRLFAQEVGFIGETFFEGFSLFETATLHGAVLSLPVGVKAGMRQRVLITDRYLEPCGDAQLTFEAVKSSYSSASGFGRSVGHPNIVGAKRA
jgi:hypothetical protein